MALRSAYPEDIFIILLSRNVYYDDRRVDLYFENSTTKERHLVEPNVEIRPKHAQYAGVASRLRATVAEDVAKFHEVNQAFRPCTAWAVGIGGCQLIDEQPAETFSPFVEHVALPPREPGGYWGDRVYVTLFAQQLYRED